MKTLPMLLLSLSICAAAWVGGRAVAAAERVAMRALDKGVKIGLVHVIGSPKEVKP